jgi:hypothetical protein
MSQYVSFVVQSWQESPDGSMRWRVCRAQSESEIHLPDAAFVVRVWIDEQGQMVRGLIHHLQSGREMQFQSGARAVEFIRGWMRDQPDPPDRDDFPAGM